MKKKGLWLLLALLAISTFSLSSVTVAFSASSEPMLKMAFIENVSQLEVKKLAGMGLDIAAVRKMIDAKGEVNYRIEAVLSARDESKLKKAGIEWQEAKLGEAATGKTMMTMMAAVETPSVYHSFDEPVLGIKDQLYQIADDYPEITKLETIGYSIQGRPLLAMRLKGKKLKQKGKGHAKKGKVLYLATHHAREWVATQMAMRFIKYLTANYGSVDRVTNILGTTEVWVIPVANPDGYEHTFTHERLWRKNLRDNDGDGAITVLDGVDLNRNFDSHWGLDEEGSSSNWSDATYRGAAPNSEPETQAVVKFVNKKKFTFIISYHTYGNLILYPWGWQVQTASYDDPIFVAQAGTDDHPAIWDSLLEQGYDPGVGADLYITNGDFTDWCYDVAGIPAHTVEFTYGYDADDSYYGFEFPDDEAMVQTVFQDNLEFMLAVAESAADPGHPVSPVGLMAEDAYHTPVTDSYGPEQIIDVLARKKSKLKLK